MTIEVKTVPEGKGKKEYTEKTTEIVKQVSKKVANLFGEEERDVTVLLFNSSGALGSRLHLEESAFSGYLDGSDQVFLIHPDAVEGLFTELWPEMERQATYAFTKFYLCKKYYPNREDFNLYYKYVAEQLGLVTGDKLKTEIIRFDVKTFIPNKRYSKEQELAIFFYFMKEHSGIEFIYEHLDEIMKEKDMKKVVEKIYNKTTEQILNPWKEKIIEEDRKLMEAEKIKRAQMRVDAQRRQQQQYSVPGSRVTRDKFKVQNNNNNQSRPQEEKKEESKYSYSAPKKGN